MNVDKLKKMNVLADTLKQHGLAASREDAANLAGTMVGSEDEQELSKIFVPEEQSVSKREEQTEEAEPETFDEGQIKSILQRFADQFCEEINSLNSKIDEQAQKLAQFEALALKAQEQPTQSEVMQPVSQPEAAEPQQQPEAAPQAPAPETKPQSQSPRSGTYESDDVSIEKFFYCGQK